MKENRNKNEANLPNNKKPGKNAKKGPIRLVYGADIQSKYCKSGIRCISECFHKRSLRSFNSNGAPKHTEVPSDKYEEAVKAMEARINNGDVEGISDPAKSEEIINKGAFTYEQVKNIAKYGSINSLSYDAVNGINLTGCAMEISAVIAFAISIWNGDDADTALKNSICMGLKIGGSAWAGSIFSAQLGKTGQEKRLRPTNSYLERKLGPKTAAWFAENLYGKTIQGEVARSHCCKLLKGNVVSTAATSIVMSSVDFDRIYNKNLSIENIFENASSRTTSIVEETITLTIDGRVSSADGIATPSASKTIIAEFNKDDAINMNQILEKVFIDMVYDYLLTEPEVEKTIKQLLRTYNLAELLKDMHTANKSRSYIKRKLLVIVESVVKERQEIIVPDEKDILKKAIEVIEQLVEEREEQV